MSENQLIVLFSTYSFPEFPILINVTIVHLVMQTEENQLFYAFFGPKYSFQMF